MNTLTALAWRTSVILLLLFISYVYAGSLEEEAKKEIMDFILTKDSLQNVAAICIVIGG